jgi:hypothetical protein
MTRLMNLLPNTFADNAFFLQTNVGTRPKLDLSLSQQLKDINFAPKKENIYYYQNDIFTLADQDFKDEKMVKQVMYSYEKCKLATVGLFKAIESCALKDVKEIIDIKANRSELRLKITLLNSLHIQNEEEKMRLAFLEKEIDSGTITLEKLRASNPEFFEEYITKITEKHNTICLICKLSCHLNCRLEELDQRNKDKIGFCQVFKNNNKICKICSHEDAHH